MTYRLIVLPMLLVAGAAQASSPDAWAKFNRDVAARCSTDSGLQRAHVSNIVGFDDTLGKVATLVSGGERMKTRKGWAVMQVKKLCIYDKRTQKTWIDEAKGWTAPNMP